MDWDLPLQTLKINYWSGKQVRGFEGGKLVGKDNEYQRAYLSSGLAGCVGEDLYNWLLRLDAGSNSALNDALPPGVSNP